MFRSRNALFFSLFLGLILLGFGMATAEASDQPILQPATPVPRPPFPPDTGKPFLEGGSPVTEPIVVARPRSDTLSTTSNTLSINVWYGHEQTFGHLGKPQEWANILGNVAGMSAVGSVSYALNGGSPQSLNLGPDNRRLAQAGDFNIELAWSDLQMGDNMVVITAVDGVSSISETVTVTRVSPTGWANPHLVVWGDATKIQDVAQIVDGQWELDGATVRPLQFDYDRLLDLGDMSWADYEVTVPLTIHGIDEDGYKSFSNGPGVGILTRWQGHYSEVAEQPRIGWRNIGGLGWFRWKNTTPRTTGFQLIANGGVRVQEVAATLAFETPYLFKMRVDTVDPVGSCTTARYRFKYWEASGNEPASWQMSACGKPGEPASGSIVLVAHHVDVSIGTVQIDVVDAIVGASAVDNLSASSANPATVALDWANLLGIDGIDIYRSSSQPYFTPDQPYATVTQVPPWQDNEPLLAGDARYYTACVTAGCGSEPLPRVGVFTYELTVPE